MFFDVGVADVSKAPGDHDRLVVTPAVQNFIVAASCRLKGTKIAAERRASEFVVVARGTKRRFEHDFERRSDSAGATVMFRPTVVDTLEVEVRYGESC